MNPGTGQTLPVGETGELLTQGYAVLFSHPDVADAAVVGIPDQRWGEQVAAFVRPAAGRTPDPAARFAYVRARLAPFKTPRFWALVDHFPLTGSGKIQKFRLQSESADQLGPVPQDTSASARS